MPIRVSEADFDISAEYSRLIADAKSTPGAIVQFVGLVRDFNEGESVKYLHLQHYEGMTETVIADICRDAEQRWDIQEPTVIHRVGQLKATDQIVMVAVASAHRADAFSACEFVMDQLKTKATFWKKESRTDGEKWLESKSTDKQRGERWSEKKSAPSSDATARQSSSKPN